MSSTNYGFKSNITVGGFTVFAANGDIVVGNIVTSGTLYSTANIVLPNSPLGALTSYPGTGYNITLDPDGSGNVVVSSNLVIPYTTPSYSPTSGALQLSGGAGIVGNVNVGGTITTPSANISALTVSNITWANGAPITTGIRYTASYAPPATNNNVGDQWYNILTDAVYEWTFNGASYYWVDISTPTIVLNPNLAVTGGMVATTANIASLTVVNGIFWANGTAWSSGGSGGTISQGANLSVSNLSVGSSNPITNTEAYDLDDISNYTDSRTNTFALTYNTATVTVPSPWSLDVYVNGVKQPAFKYNGDTFWLGYALTANKGYTLDYSGNLRFADALPGRSSVTITTKVGTNSQNTKRYPFNPPDIVLGI
jgi:hypothetical protein